MRLLAVLITCLALVGCLSKKTDYNEKPKECSSRDIDMGLCVPGEYEDS
jgi:hypothetical protein